MREIHVFYVDLFQDDPQKSTMKKLRRFGMASRVEMKSMGKHLVIRADSNQILLNSDKVLVERKGICLIEGSWKSGMLLEGIRTNFSRRLPKLLAGNPVNFGKWEKLSSVEAVCATLHITGHIEQAEKILSKFSWGHTFLETNLELLKAYESCKNYEEFEEIYREFGIS